MAGGSVIRGGNGWKVDNGQRLFSFGRNRSREQGGGSRRKDSQHSRFFALKYFCSSEKLKNPAAFVELPPSSLSLSLYESSLTLEKRRERGRDFVFDDKHRVPLRESFHSFSWLSARIHAHARLNSRYACIFLCASWFHNSLSIYIYIHRSKHRRAATYPAPWNDHPFRLRLIFPYFNSLSFFANQIFVFATRFPPLRPDPFFSISFLLPLSSFTFLRFTRSRRGNI